MTEALYHTDSYTQTFEANVTRVDDEAHAVVLDRTAFYPGGGGQPADKGTLSANGKVYNLDAAGNSTSGNGVHLYSNSSIYNEDGIGLAIYDPGTVDVNIGGN